jgi:chitin synthase
MSGQKRWRYLGHPTQLKVGIDDARGFHEFKTALRRLEFSKQDIAGICEVMAIILHIGQLEFETGQSTTPGADDSGGYSHEGGESVTMVKNKDSLGPVAQFLGTSINDLEQSLRYKTKTLYRERVTVMLDPKGARANADELARTLYSLLVAYVMEQINSRISVHADQVANTVSLIDFPGFSHTSATGSGFDQLLNNSANECLYNFCQQSFFGRQIEEMEAEEISVPQMEYYDNSEAKTGLLKSGNGLLSILDDQMRRGKNDMQFLEAIRKRFDGKNDSILPGSLMVTQPGSNFPTPNTSASFTVRHYAGEVEYPVENLIEENAELISGDMMNLLKTANSPFIQELFGQDVLKKVTHPKEKATIVQASVSSKPSRMPSVARRTSKSGRFGRQRNTFDDDPISDVDSAVSSGKKVESAGKQTGAAGQFLSSLKTIESALNKANPYFVFCLKPNDRRIANQFDSKCVRAQVQALGIAEISKRLRIADFSLFLPYAEFLGLAAPDAAIIGSERERAETVLENRPWRENEVRLGATGVFLSERCWLEIANVMEVTPTSRGLSGSDDNLLTPGPTRSLNDPRTGLLSPSPGAFYHDDKGGNYFGSKDIDARSEAPSGITNGDMFHGLETSKPLDEKAADKKLEEVDVVDVSGSRKRWLFIVYMLTWYIPDFAIRLIGRMKRKDVRVAWREKLAINMLIWLCCGFFIFLMSRSMFPVSSSKLLIICSWLPSCHLPGAGCVLGCRAFLLQRQGR